MGMAESRNGPPAMLAPERNHPALSMTRPVSWKRDGRRATQWAMHIRVAAWAKASGQNLGKTCRLWLLWTVHAPLVRLPRDRKGLSGTVSGGRPGALGK